MEPMESPIAKVLLHYFPDWECPEDNGREWVKCLCPAHEESRPSASVSFVNGAVNCMACGFKGDIISIIRRKEEIGYVEAVRRAEEISGGSDFGISRKPTRKPRRRAFGQARADDTQRERGGRPLPPWLRS